MMHMASAPTALKRIRLHVLSLIAMAAVYALAAADSPAVTTNNAIDFHIISSGGKTLRNSCFRLSGTTGQMAPGFSSGATNSIVAGFGSAAPTSGLDEIFFHGFEGC